MADEATAPRDESKEQQVAESRRDGDQQGDDSPREANKGAPQRAEISNYEIVSHHFGKAVERLDIRDDVATVLKSSYREVQVQIPVKQTDGRIHVYSGFRVQHNGARGPYKGGIRF